MLICAPLERLEADVLACAPPWLRHRASVLGGFELGTDEHVVRFPERYMDPRGKVMWDRVMDLIAQRESWRRSWWLEWRAARLICPT